MESSTRNVLIGVVVAMLLSLFVCCSGIGAYFFFASPSDTDWGPAPEPAPTVVTHAKRTDLNALWKSAKKEGWKLPSKPTLGKRIKPPRGELRRSTEFSYEPGFRAPKALTVSPEGSAFLTAAMLTNKKPREFAEQVRLTGSETNTAINLGGFSSCGPLAALHAQKHGSAGSFFSYLTRDGCRIDTTIQKPRGSDGYVPTKIEMFTDDLPLFIVRLHKIDPSEARRVAKKHGKDIFEKVRKARRAGMNAQHYYSGETLGNSRLLRDIIPKAKVVRDIKIVMKLNGIAYQSVGYDLLVDGEPVEYRVYFTPLSTISKKKRDDKYFIIIGEDLTLD